MFEFTTKSRYGVSAILEMAKNYGNAPLPVKDIAAKHNISPQYLEQLLGRLIKSGLIRAVRGQRGGFVLSRPPQEIALIDVLEALEGPLAIVQSVPHDDVMIEYAMQTEATLRRVLDVPLSDVLARQAARTVMFHI
jgi:Rrf2 family cysteine metabolism transcriptional repressor